MNKAHENKAVLSPSKHGATKTLRRKNPPVSLLSISMASLNLNDEIDHFKIDIIILFI